MKSSHFLYPNPVQGQEWMHMDFTCMSAYWNEQNIKEGTAGFFLQKFRKKASAFK